MYWFDFTPTAVLSAPIRAVERISTRRTNLKPINMTTKSFSRFSKQLRIWHENKQNFVCVWPNLNFVSSHRCSFSGCAKEFPSHGKLKHHEKVHKG